MKKSQLKQLIKEEIHNLLEDQLFNITITGIK